MTAKIVRILENENPELVTMFNEGYRKSLLSKITSKTIEGCKALVENYIDKQFKDVLLNQKLYCYKKLDDIVVEILLKPIRTATIMEYHLIISKNNCELKRIR